VATCRTANCLDRQTAGPKGNLSPFGHVVDSYVVSTRYEGHGAKYRPKVTEKWIHLSALTAVRQAERGNPPSALSGKTRAGDQAVSLGGVGCPKKLMPYCNGEDMQT